MQYLLLAFLFISVNAQAQLKGYIIGVKGDTLNRIDMKGLKQGPWVIHVDALRGESGYEEEGIFKDDKKEGMWRRFSLDGDMVAVENYAYGMKNGKCSYYTEAGDLMREESWRAIDPRSPYDTINVLDVNDPTKILRKEIIKVEPNSYKHGTWRYYNTQTGAIESTEQWVMNKPKTETNSTDELAPIDVTTGNSTAVKKADKKQMAKPKEVLDYEKKNSGKKKIKVRDGRTGG